MWGKEESESVLYMCKDVDNYGCPLYSCLHKAEISFNHVGAMLYSNVGVYIVFAKLGP